jgi:hypothetical protein
MEGHKMQMKLREIGQNGSAAGAFVPVFVPEELRDAEGDEPPEPARGCLALASEHPPSVDVSFSREALGHRDAMPALLRGVDEAPHHPPERSFTGSDVFQPGLCARLSFDRPSCSTRRAGDRQSHAALRRNQPWTANRIISGVRMPGSAKA